jgi:chloramphenicol 3-O-phosphotransferase
MKNVKKLFFGLTIVLVAFASIQSIMTVGAVKNPVAVLLTGTSSAGKTSTTKALKKQYGDSYTIINYDDFLDGKDWEKIKEALALKWGWDNASGVDLGSFIESYLNDSTKVEDRKVFENALNGGGVQYIQERALLSKNIVVDTTQAYVYENFSTIISADRFIKVLLYCPLSMIGQRIEKRNASGDFDEFRDLWQPFLAFPDVYKIQESADEIVVDTIVYSDQLKQLLISGIEGVKKCHFSAYDSPEELKAFETFYADFLKKLEDHHEVVITTRIPFDLVINTGTNSPDQAAKSIVDFVM